MQLKGLTKHMLGASNRKARILVAREMRTRSKRNDYSWRRVRRVVIVAFEKHSKCNCVDVQCLINQIWNGALNRGMSRRFEYYRDFNSIST